MMDMVKGYFDHISAAATSYGNYFSLIVGNISDTIASNNTLINTVATVEKYN